MFSEDQGRATGRDTSGVRGIGMKADAEVLGMEITNGSVRTRCAPPVAIRAASAVSV